MRYLQSLLADDFPPSRGELRKQLRSRFAYSRKNCGGQKREKLELGLAACLFGVGGRGGHLGKWVLPPAESGVGGAQAEKPLSPAHSGLVGRWAFEK
jgi:hypothetical protein